MQSLETAGFGSLPVNTADLDAGFTPEAEAEVASSRLSSYCSYRFKPLTTICKKVAP